MQKVAAALVKAQRQFSPALKSATNPHFKTKYADLSACVEAVIDALGSNGIFLSQPCHESDTGVIVETIFLHESGESFSAGKLHVPASKQDPQGYGSALTYARRYSLMAACGIAARTFSMIPRYFDLRYERFIALRTLSEPDCNGMCSCGMTFGVSAIASMTSSVNSAGCGDVKRTRSSPSI